MTYFPLRQTTCFFIPLVAPCKPLLPIVYDKDGVVFDSICDIKSAIASAKRIQERLDLGWRPVEISYTIKQLYQDILSIIDKEVLYSVKD